MSLVAIDNALIFDGASSDCMEGGSLLIEGGEIREVADRPVRAANARRIDAGGRFCMPGLIDLHVHCFVSDLDVRKVDRAGEAFRTAYGIRLLGHALDCGFTTVRDVGGGNFSMARAVDAGLVRGPRYLYAGRILSMTGGHGDLRDPGEEHHEGGGDCLCGACNSVTRIVDGVDACIRAAREELRKGAHCLKVMASGGVSSPTDPIWSAQFRSDEIEAIVGEAARRGTYVAAHCNPPEAIRQAVAAGVRTIEHAALIDEDAAKFMAERDAFAVPTAAVFLALSEMGEKIGASGSWREKAELVAGYALSSLETLKAAGVRMGFGTDLIGELYVRQCQEFLVRSQIFSPLEILRQATSVGAEILMRPGKLGCLAPGAAADLLLIDGNPLEDIALLGRNGEAIAMIMKDGAIVKDRLGAGS